MTAFPTLNDTTTLTPEAQRVQDIDLVMQAAIEHHRKQEYADAAALYTAVLDADSDHVDANYHMGVLRMQTDLPAEAVPHFERVLGHTPNFAQLWVYYFNALVGSGQFEAARVALELALQCGVPADAIATLRVRLAEESSQAAIAVSMPDHPQQHSIEEAPPASDADPRRASAAEMQEYATLFNSGEIDAALGVARRLADSYPGHGECWLALAHALQRNGRFAESVSAAEPAARLLPDQVIAQTMLADALYIVRQFVRAEAHCRKALKQHPESAALHRTLGATLQVVGRSAEGIANVRRAVELAPHDALELDALGNALSQHGEYDEAEVTFRRALEMAPTQAPTNSNLLFSLMHKHDLDAPAAFAEFRAFAQRFEAPVRAHWPQHTNERNPAKRLKVGFVSGDLFDHPVAYFLLSVVEHLARDENLSLHFYSNYAASDGFTEKIRAHANSWREVFGMSDAVVAQTIRDDGIDILIDLSGHTGRNRLVAFAHKPAPVQVGWIGNPATTGLAAIDYYMSDRFVTPLEQFASQFSEKLVFLPALAPFKPHPEAPEVNELPALKNGYLTFGSFSRIVKIGPQVVALWARVLRALPTSRMLVGAIASTEQMSKIAAMFADENIDASRISFMQRKSVANYLQQHHMVDVCLDAFPFAGSTTTMHALWMGVPTMTLPGYSMASRGSTGWLSHLGLQDAFVATDKDDFVQKCAALAADPEALAAVRRELRQHCMQSPIVSANTIANAASRALRIMWQRWCDGLEPEHFEVQSQAAQTKVAAPMQISDWKNLAKVAISENSDAHEAIAQFGTQPVTSDDWEVNFLLGMLYGKTQQLESAVQYLRQSLAQNANNPDAIFYLGNFHAAQFSGIHKSWAIRRDHAKRALALVENLPAGTIWPQLKACLETLSIAATYVGPSEDAEFAYRWLIKIDPTTADHYANLSQLRAADDLEEAITLLDKARSINPNVGNQTDIELSRKALSSANRRTPIARAKFPTMKEMDGELKSVIQAYLLNDLPKQKFIDKETRFFTLGSCFAREIAVRLLEKGFKADFFEVVEHINSSFANRSMIDWALGKCTGQSRNRLDELFSALNITPQNLRDRLSATNVFVYTLGVAPAFFDRQTGEFAMPSNSTLGSRAFAELYDFRTTTVQQNLDNLEYITSQIRMLSPDVKIVLTVSPVPLKTTFEMKSAVQADCISKSTLRVVAHEFVSKHRDVVYWPGFEVVRWLGGHVGPFFGNDDGAALHVDDDVVKAITDSFIEHYS